MENIKSIKLNKSVLVLNSDYNPINIANAKKAFKLLVKRKAEFINEKVIRLIHYIYLPISRIRNTKPSRRAIHLRDGNKCVYCGSTKDLTIDHLIPSSRGGLNTWDNLVCACIKCNTAKGARTPQEANMRFNRNPTTPFNKVLFRVENSNISEWKEYVYA
jgi:hypothetical protein